MNKVAAIIIICLLFTLILSVSYLLIKNKINVNNFNNNNPKTYVLMYGFGYEKQLSEFITYYLYVLNFDKVLFVEDFESEKSFKNDTVMKNICKIFGNRVEYDYLIRTNGDCDLFSHPFTIKRDKCQLYITFNYLKKLKSRIPKNEQDNTWLLYVNGDEFLNLNGLTIQEHIMKYAKNYIGLSFMQQMFGDNGVEEHKHNNLLIDTHRISEKIKIDKIPNYIRKYVGVFSGINYSDVGKFGFKAMYRISKLNTGWIHPKRDYLSIKDIYNSNLLNIDLYLLLSLSPYYFTISYSDFTKLNIKTIHHDIANINHYWVIDKKAANNHFISKMKSKVVKHFNNRFEDRKIINTLINKNGKEYSNLYIYSDLIRNNTYYKQCMEYLDTIFN
tara:strand:+ start:33 stop:1193 length:1161 start_codon:yes stop_codon:yes gene_type:complete